MAGCRTGGRAHEAGPRGKVQKEGPVPDTATIHGNLRGEEAKRLRGSRISNVQ